MDAHQVGVARAARLSERSLSVGMAQASGAFESRAVSDMESLETVFSSDLPKKIKPLNEDKGLIVTCKPHRWIKVQGGE